MIPTLWADSAIGGEDGKRGLEWLRGTKAGRELERKDEEGLSLVSGVRAKPVLRLSLLHLA